MTAGERDVALTDEERDALENAAIATNGYFPDDLHAVAARIIGERVAQARKDALAHIAAVLRDEATVEACETATWSRMVTDGPDGHADGYELIAADVLAVIAERLGITDEEPT